MEEVIKTIKTRKGGTVSLIKPDNGHPFFRYLAGAVATTDSFRYVIRQHGQEDTATVNIQVKLPQSNENDDQKNFNNALKGFLGCVDAFMDGSPGTMALTNLLGIDEGDVLNDDWVEKVFSSFRYVDYAREGEAIEFEKHLGHYHYRGKEGYWEYEPGGEFVVIHFPASVKSEGNDAEWVIRHLKTIPSQTENDLYHLPVFFDSQLSIKGKELLSLKINEVRYFENTAIPLFIDLEAVAWPYVLRANLDSNNGKEFAIRGNITNEQGCHLDIDTIWHVNQDLRNPLEEGNIHMVHGNLGLNEISFTNLNSLWEAAKSNIEDQKELDKMVNIECLLKGKKIGDVRYIIKEEIVELVYLDGARQNISDIVIEHFKQYFNQPKPTGEIRNNAFDARAHATFRTTSIPINSITDTKKKTTTNLVQALRRRTVRNGASLGKVGETMASLFHVEQPPHFPAPVYTHTPYYPGEVTPLPGYSLNPEPIPGIIESEPDIVPSVRPTLEPEAVRTPTIKPPKASAAPTIKSGAGINPSITPAKATSIQSKNPTIKTQPGAKTKGSAAAIKTQPGAKTKGGAATIKTQPGAKTKGGAATIKAQPGAKTKGGAATIKAQPGAKTKGGAATIKAQPGAKTKGGTATIKAQPGAKTKGGAATIKTKPGAKTK